ncbi:MAG: hypothetical protein NDI94_00735, partial [Candidatus Woesearchaeota archaeon]|nr:hypothetical protein [Candidatus Woesearchaeota archaeon]
IAREAKEQGIPVYVCLHTLKHGRHKIDASVFETLPENMVTGYITEHGIFDSKHIDEEMHFFRKLM